MKNAANDVNMKIIAKIFTEFPTKFGIPRQSGLANGLEGKIIFEKEFRNPDSLRGLSDFSHLWLIWHFSKSERDGWSPTVRPPRLGGNKRMGVFATRSPFRPNAIGLSSVRLLRIEHTTEFGDIIYVSGADLMDGTPIFDIKPYLPFSDSHPDASGGFAADFLDYRLQVEFPNEFLSLVPDNKRETLFSVLSEDPRPSYQSNPERIYGFRFCGLEIKFTVADGILTVCEVAEL